MTDSMWLVWALQGEYSDRDEWPICVVADEDRAKQVTERMGQLWRFLCQEYERREDELDRARDWNGSAVMDSDEGRELLALGESNVYLSTSRDVKERMYTCAEVRIVS